MAIRRACLACGTPVPVGDPCPRCAGARYTIRSSCVECGQPATAGPHCDTHKPRPDEARRRTYRQAYRDPNYHRERQGALNRAKGRCERCGGPGPLECDHIIPLRDGGTNTRANLVILCQPCHRAKTRADRRAR